VCQYIVASEAGEFVTFKYMDTAVTMKKTKAMRQLVWLIENPNTDIPATVLAQIDGSSSNTQSRSLPYSATRPSRIPVIDGQARAEYGRRVREIRNMLGEPTNDPADEVALREELGWLNEVLAKARGLNGRTRFVGDLEERARISVRNNLSNAIKRVRRQGERMGVHLANSVHTGSCCSYRPERS